MQDKILQNTQISVDIKFTQKLCLCLHLLGAESDLISSVSSWKDTMDDEQVLHSLDLWIDATLNEQQRTISHVQKWHNKQ
jgi:hypothetical protein